MHLLWPGPSYHTMVSLSVKKTVYCSFWTGIELCDKERIYRYLLKAETGLRLAALTRSLSM